MRVSSLIKSIKVMGNPLLGNFPELLILDNRKCADISVIKTIREIEDTRKAQYKGFVNDVLDKQLRSIHQPIK